MDNLTLPAGMTGADIAVIVVFLVAAAWGYSKGLVHGILFIGAWVGAVLITWYGYGYARPYANELIRISFVADMSAIAVLFLGSLVVLLLVSRWAAGQVRDSALGIIDRTLGFAFGAAAAAVLFSLAHIALGWILAPDEQPEWLAESRTLPLIAQGSDMILSYAPDDFVISDLDMGSDDEEPDQREEN